MKRLHFAVGLFAALACSGLQAQTPLRANIPFEFRMGQTSFQSGEYVFQLSSHILVVRQAEGQHSAVMTLTQSAWRLNKPETSLLEFNRYGDTYFLSKLWIQGSTDGEALPSTSHEKELARRITPIRTEAIALKTK
jgi:hypothetical protein